MVTHSGAYLRRFLDRGRRSATAVRRWCRCRFKMCGGDIDCDEHGTYWKCRECERKVR